MCPCESSHTLWVLPYLMLDGSWPQSWMHSYWCSPSPRILFFDPLLLSAPLMKNGAAAAALAVRNVRRVASLMLAFLSYIAHKATRAPRSLCCLAFRIILPLSDRSG